MELEPLLIWEIDTVPTKETIKKAQLKLVKELKDINEEIVKYIEAGMDYKTKYLVPTNGESEEKKFLEYFKPRYAYEKLQKHHPNLVRQIFKSVPKNIIHNTHTLGYLMNSK